MNLKQSILATLAYHGIFNYPLNSEEAFKYLIENNSSRDAVKRALKDLQSGKYIQKESNFYSLARSKNLSNQRGIRQRYSRDKFRKALFFSKILKLIPTIKLVAISGALAMENSSKSDDIDFVIITSQQRLWTTRLLCNLILLPYKRNPKSNTQNNKACLNLFISENHLKITNENLYTAHEICQMKPVWDQSDTYNRFIKSNLWVKEYLPNWNPNFKNKSGELLKKHPSALADLLELLARKAQLSYMAKKITNEKILEGQLYFHPKNTQKKVLSIYADLTDKLFRSR